MKKCFLIIQILFCINIFAQDVTRIDKLIEKNYFVIDTLYKHFHKYPELSEQEKETSKLVATQLRSYGYQVTENFGGYGVVSIFQNGKGPIIMVRADMDALPIEEKTGVFFSSCAKGLNQDGREVSIMHACGHDIHTSVLIGTAKILMETKNSWKGTLMFVSQPAEEDGDGAKKMIEAGLFQKFFKPDYALALHVSPFIESGSIAYCIGPTYASVDEIKISVFGKGGHGASPESTIDPIVLSSRLILDLQTLISREKAAIDPAVLTVGSIHGGTRSNIIPDEVKLLLTLRTYNDQVKTHIIEGIHRICKGTAISAGLTNDKFPKVEIEKASLPPVINDENLTKKMVNIFSKVLGPDKVTQGRPIMGGEDFGRYGRTSENVPICIYWLGSVSQDKIADFKDKKNSLPGTHSPFYIPDIEKTLKTGIKCMSLGVIEILNNK